MSDYTRSEEGEARRIAALRSPDSRAKMSDSKKGKTPENFEIAQKKAWEANKKEVLTYSGIHAWVKRSWGKANCCELCGKTDLSGRQAHWANRDHKYTRDRSDWMMVCRPCHAEFDQANNNVSFSTARSEMTHCHRGHEFTPENTRIYDGCRHCVACAKERHLETYVKRERKPKTHCINGHELTPENTYVGPKCRECKTCRAERVREWKQKNREKSAQITIDS